MNDLDPLLHEAMARVRGPVDTRPSVTDVRRRARRHTRRRMAATAGALACTGVATAALVIRRDASDTSTVASASVDAAATSSVFMPPQFSTTTIDVSAQVKVDAELVWNALLTASNDPAGVSFVASPTDEVAAHTMPTAEQFGCSTDECRGMFTYVVWHEIAKRLGFTDVLELQAVNPDVDYTVPPVEGAVLDTPYASLDAAPDPNVGGETTTTLSIFEGIVLIDGGAPAGAMEDAYQRLPGYDRTIVPSSGKTVERTMVMPIDGNVALATAVGGVFGLGGVDTWDPSLIGTNIQGMVAVVIGPDYFDHVQDVGATVDTTATTTTIVG